MLLLLLYMAGSATAFEAPWQKDLLGGPHSQQGCHGTSHASVTGWQRVARAAAVVAVLAQCGLPLLVCAIALRLSNVVSKRCAIAALSACTACSTACKHRMPGLLEVRPGAFLRQNSR